MIQDLFTNDSVLLKESLRNMSRYSSLSRYVTTVCKRVLIKSLFVYNIFPIIHFVSVGESVNQ